MESISGFMVAPAAEGMPRETADKTAAEAVLLAARVREAAMV